MLTLAPRFTDRPSAGGSNLGTVRFGGVTQLEEGGLNLAIPPIDGVSREIWPSDSPVTHGTGGAIAFGKNRDVLFGAIVDEDDDVESAARRAYDDIVRVARGEGYPHLLRVWNHVRDLNAGAGDEERYKRFCAGRHDALTAAGYSKIEFPAASAVGMGDGSLAVYFLASRTPGRQVENPRQVSAYDYPREFGSRSPSFSRAAVAGKSVFVSGTASVIGSATVHAGDSAAQTEETIANLLRILAACGAASERVRTLKVYVRSGVSAAPIAARILATFPAAELMLLEAAICRRDLLLEVEAVAVLP